MASQSLPVVEIFGPTLQGEGPEAGQKQHFVRFGFCDGAGQGWCTWCDTMDAVDPANKKDWRMMTVEQIYNELAELPPAGWVSITGGNPAIHDLGSLVMHLKKTHNPPYKINVETQGTIPRYWFQQCDLVTLSPKPPSAGSVFTEAMWDNLRACMYVGGQAILKVVVDPWSAADFEFAKEVHRRHPNVPFYFSVLTNADRAAEQYLIMAWRRLAQKVLDDSTLRDVAVLPQLHVLLWGTKKGV